MGELRERNGNVQDHRDYAGNPELLGDGEQRGRLGFRCSFGDWRRLRQRRRCVRFAQHDDPYFGGSVTLTASCTQSPTSYAWTGCTSATSTCVATSDTLGPANYSVIASNSSFGPGSAAPVSVTWQTPPPVGADFCSLYPDVMRVELPWAATFDTYHNGRLRLDRCS